MNIDLVIFDMDGTLLDSETLSMLVWMESAKEWGVKLSEKNFLERILGTNRLHIEEQLKILFGKDFDSNKFVEYTNKKHTNMVNKNGINLKNGVLDILAHLDNLGIKKAVATSSSRDRCEHMLSKANILDRFDFIICGNEVEKSKPNPDIFLKVSEHFNVAPENCIVFEDSRNGIKAAKSANMKPILVPDLLKPDNELINISYKIINSIDEAIDFIK